MCRVSEIIIIWTRSLFVLLVTLNIMGYWAVSLAPTLPFRNQPSGPIQTCDNQALPDAPDCKAAIRGDEIKLKMRTLGAYFPKVTNIFENGWYTSLLPSAPNLGTRNKSYPTLSSPLRILWLFLKLHNNWRCPCPEHQKKSKSFNPCSPSCLQMGAEQSSRGALRLQ